MQTGGEDHGNIPDDDTDKPETEHRTEKRTASAIHRALEKIIKNVSSYLKHNKVNTDNSGSDSDYDEDEPEETGEPVEYIEEEEEYAKAKCYELTREERCHLKAQGDGTAWQEERGIFAVSFILRSDASPRRDCHMLSKRAYIQVCKILHGGCAVPFPGL